MEILMQTWLFILTTNWYIFVLSKADHIHILDLYSYGAVNELAGETHKNIIFFQRFYYFSRILWHFLFSVEHNLGIASGLYLSKSCWNVQSAEEAYFRQSFTDFFSVFEFNIYLGILAQTVNVFWYALSHLNIRWNNQDYFFTVK